MEKAAPLLTAAIFTFNHGKYIARALDCILEQEVNFPMEIIVGDDASGDETVSILKEYKGRYPERLTLLLADKNEGVFENVMKVIRAAEGKYIALLEGDDYWTYPEKLQQQVDFLEANPDYSGCFHDTKVVYDKEAALPNSLNYLSGTRTYSQFNTYQEEFNPWDLVVRNIIPTSALVFCNRDLTKEMEAFRSVSLSLSWALELVVIKKDVNNSGKFRYINEVWSAYNNHDGGITKVHHGAKFIRSNIKILKLLLKDPYYKSIRAEIYQSLMREYQNYFFNPGPGTGKSFRFKLILQFIRFGLNYVAWRSYYLSKALKNK